MTTELLSPLPIQHFVDNNGNALTGGKLFVYLAGTTTKSTSFTDSTGSTPNPNPVILNSRGEANVWTPPGLVLKFVLSPATDTDPPTNAIWTVDNIIPQAAVSAAMTPVVGAPTIAAAVSLLGVAGTSFANVFTAAQTLESTTAGSAGEDFLTIWRNKGAGVNGDGLERIVLAGENTSSAQVGFAKIGASISTALAGSEAGVFFIQTIQAGAIGTPVTVGRGVQIGAPTGADKGVGTINAASGFFVNGAAANRVAGTQAVMNPYASASAVTQAHGLGALPTELIWQLVCLTGEFGFSVGDSIFINNIGDSSQAFNTGISLSANSTNVIIQTAFGGTVEIPRRDAGGGGVGTCVNITAASWKLVVTPFM